MEQDAATRRRPKRLGPPHLRIVEVDFLKPTLRNESEWGLENESEWGLEGAERTMGGPPIGDLE